jgi:hypothetical protein
MLNHLIVDFEFSTNTYEVTPSYLSIDDSRNDSKTEIMKQFDLLRPEVEYDILGYLSGFDWSTYGGNYKHCYNEYRIPYPDEDTIIVGLGIVNDAPFIYKYLHDPPQVIDLQFTLERLGVPTSLSSAITHYFPDTTVDKSCQRADWLKRPLSDSMKRYALMDVVYTKQLFRILKNDISEEDVEKSMRLYNAHKLHKPRVCKLSQIKCGNLPNLHEKKVAFIVWAYREIIAKRKNICIGFYMSHDKMKNFVIEIIRQYNTDRSLINPELQPVFKFIDTVYHLISDDIETNTIETVEPYLSV